VVAVWLAVFLAGALYFHAPWKITFILALMFSNITIIPKPARKYIDLGIASAFVIIAVWIFIPDRSSRDWQPCTFDEEQAQLEACRPAVTSQDAAHAYGRIFDSYPEYTFDHIFRVADPGHLTLSEPWSDDQYPRLAAWMADNRIAFDSLYAASALPHCRFPLPVNNLALDTQMRRLNLMERWGRIVLRAVNNDIANDRGAEALKKTATLRQMAAHLYQQKTLYDHARALTLDQMAAHTSNRVVICCNLTDAQTQQIEESLERVTDTFEDDWPSILACEKLLAKNTMGLLYEVNDDGRIRHSRNSIPAIDRQFHMGLYVIRRYGYAPRLTALMLCLVLPRSPLDCAEAIDNAYESFSPDNPSYQPPDIEHIVSNMELNYKGLIELAAFWRTSFYYAIRTRSLKNIRSKRATRILIALKKHKNRTGQWPDSLASVKADIETFVDPVNGDEFVYKRQGDDFVLYSKGKNGIDDDGRNEPREKTDDIMIWPIQTKCSV
jgi:hypothetical protein